MGHPDIEVLKKLATFKGESMLKKAALNMVIKMTSSRELDGLKKEFAKIDKLQTGLISEEGLHKVFVKAGLKVSCEEVH
jgi:Ca2+-binding EF-hand superfamily protein